VARAGEPIHASWQDVKAPSADDWIGLFPRDAPEDAAIAPVPTGGGAAGSLPVAIPANIAPGRYELRLFARGGWTRLATSGPVQIAPSTTSLEPIGGPFRAGSFLTAAWADMPAPAKDDWIGVFAVGQPDDGADQARVPFAFTGGGPAGSVRIEIPPRAAPGAYELRLFSRARGERHATSRPFRLRRPEPR
jgi:hypothetical protein